MTNLIAHYEAHMRAAGYSRNTVEDRGKLLRRLDVDLPLGLAEATTEEIADWMAQVGSDRDPWSQKTLATYYDGIRGFFVYHCDPGKPVGLDWDPSAGLTRPRAPRGVPRPVTDDQLAEALGRAAEPWRTYVLLAAYGGMRPFEISRQDRRHITEESVTIINGKGGKSRIVPTFPLVWHAVRDLPPGLVAQPSSTGRLDADYISSETSRYLRERLKLPGGMTLHRCRHWYATTLLGRGANLRVVQELLGHASPATTAIYTQITDEQRRIAVAALPALAPAPN